MSGPYEAFGDVGVRTGSAFLEALNSGGETFRGISYTSIATHYDQIVPTGIGMHLTALHTGRGSIANVLVQDICPTNTADHYLLGTADPVGYALVVDALDHAGPADPQRLAPQVCLDTVHPGVDPESYPADLARLVAASQTSFVTHPRTAQEPPLRPTVRRGHP